MKIFRKNKYSILSNFLKYSFLLVIAFSLFASVNFVSADKNCGDTGQSPCVNTTPTQTKVNITIENPLGPKLTSLPAFIEAILNIVLIIGVPIVTLAIIYAGFLFVQAQGNTEKITKAKMTLLYTIIGAALLLGAFVVANAIKGTVDDIKSTTLETQQHNYL